MKRRDMLLWGGCAAFFCVAVYAALRIGGWRDAAPPPGEPPLRAPLQGFNPVQYHSQRAFAYEADGSFEHAAEEYLKLIEMNPGDAALHSHLSAVYYKMGKKDKAIEEIKEVLRLDPGDWAQHEALADLYAEEGEFDLARDHYEESLRINPENALCLSKLGRLYYMAKNYDDAVRAYMKSISIDSNLPEARMGLGLCFVATGNIEGARREREALSKMHIELASQLADAIATRQLMVPPSR